MANKQDWFGAIFIAAIVSLAIGYAWGLHGGKQVAAQEYEEQYEADIERLTVIVRDDVCPNGI